jgi:hypothetical protein
VARGKALADEVKTRRVELVEAAVALGCHPPESRSTGVP